MNENTNNKTKHPILIAIISFMMGGCCFYIFAQPMTTTAELQDKVFNTGEIRNDKIGETKTGQILLSKGRIKTTNGSTKSNSDNKVQSMVAKIIHKGFPKDSIQQQMIQYSYEIGGENLLFLGECENGSWNFKKVGDHGNAVGMCQAWVNNRVWMKNHKWIDVKKYKADRKYQIEVCRKLRQEGTPFYGPTRKVNGKSCHVTVKDRFIFTGNK